MPLEQPPITQAPHTEVTKLGNGVKIASEDTPGPTASIGLYINAGSVNEDSSTTGASHLLEFLAFKSTQHRTHFRLTREVENIGANIAASASREQLVYVVDVAKVAVPEALEILTDAVLNPKFNLWEVRDAAERLEADIKALGAAPQQQLLEGLHAVAYKGPLGRPLIAPPGAASRLTPDHLAHFVDTNFRGGNIVLAGAGVAHGSLDSLARPLLEGVAPGGGKPSPSEYIGGDFRTTTSDPTSHAILAFEVPGGWHDMKTSISATVLQFLLGGGGSFSSGGPGKGMHSRLYTRVLNQHGWVRNATAFSSLYNESGIAGIYIETDSNRIEAGVDVACKELQSLTKDVPAAELERAKKGALATVLSSLESRAIVAEDIGRQILTYGSRKPVAEFLSILEGITASDISGLATKMLKTPPAFAGAGDTVNMPRYATLQRRFG